MTNQKLTPQQSRFVLEFAELLEPKTAALRAGYRPKDAARRAQELLNNPRIIDELYRVIESCATKLLPNRAFFTKKLLDIIAYASLADPQHGGKPVDPTLALRALDLLSKYCREASSDGSKSKPASETDNAEQGPDIRVLCIENLDENKI